MKVNVVPTRRCGGGGVESNQCLTGTINMYTVHHLMVEMQKEDQEVNNLDLHDISETRAYT